MLEITGALILAGLFFVNGGVKMGSFFVKKLRKLTLNPNAKIANDNLI
jgi:hypothetical protein